MKLIKKRSGIYLIFNHKINSKYRPVLHWIFYIWLNFSHSWLMFISTQIFRKKNLFLICSNQAHYKLGAQFQIFFSQDFQVMEVKSWIEWLNLTVSCEKDAKIDVFIDICSSRVILSDFCRFQRSSDRRGFTVYWNE